MAKTVAEQIATALLSGLQAVMEDNMSGRVDNLAKQYMKLTGQELAADPKEQARQIQANRAKIEQWMDMDPTANKKYVPWIIKQIANKALKLPQQAMQLKDDLMSFERILKIPAYTGNRDIYQFPTYKDFHDTITQHGELRSKGEMEREKLQAGVTKVAQVGNLELLKITSPQALIQWAWRAYDPATNPNWKAAKVTPKLDAGGQVQADLQDGLWCVRFPSYANSYLSGGTPFYLVLKNGGPYAGIIFERGECQDLYNNRKQPDHDMKMSQVEEIYPVLRDVIPSASSLTGRCAKLSKMRFLNGDVKDGETVQGPIDLAGTSLKALPNNLTVKGNLDISSTKVSTLPVGLKVEGTLKIQGTRISELPNDLFVEDLEWSEPLDWKKIKHLFYLRRHMDMQKHFFEHDKIKGGSAEERNQRWINFQPALAAYFQKDPEVDRHVKTVYRHVPVAKKGKEAATEENE